MTRKSNLWGSLVGVRVALTLAGCGVVLLGSRTSAAQTWQGNREVPSVSEIVAIDATGESGWQYGAEDVAGDGLANFGDAEQRIDVRTAYATTDASRFYFRLYVSSTSNASRQMTAFVFVDADRNPLTGGVAGPQFESRFLTDNSSGGYEYVVGVDGDGNLRNIWRWDAATARFEGMEPAQLAESRGSVGEADDPLRAQARNHGYIQGSVPLGVVGLSQACEANLYFRTVQETQGLGPGDLDVGAAGSCQPATTSGVPTVVNPNTTNPTWQCATSADCPADGVCVNGMCLFPQYCAINADCPQGYECFDGRCVVVVTGGTQCTSDAQCAPLVCLNGACVACYVTGADCPPGQLCAADGRCFTPAVAVGAECFSDAQCLSHVCLNGLCVGCNTAGAECPPGQICADNGICYIPGQVGTECSYDAQCFSGLCINGRCADCRTAGVSCPPGEICTADGRCVGQVGSQCVADYQCVTGVCLNGFCVDCRSAGAECPPGQVCASDGRCYLPAGAGGAGPGVGLAGSAGLYLKPGEEIQGGSCTCTLVTQQRNWLAGLVLGGLVALGLGRRLRNPRAGR